RAMRRGHDVPLLERAAHADRHRLLADRDVQEARQLARAEPLLDLLLEAADEQHLAEAIAEILLRERLPLLQLGHALSLETPCRMLRPWRSSSSGDRSRHSFPSAGRPPA